MPTPVGNVPSGNGESSFFEKIAPGGKYFKYALGAGIAIGVTTLTLVAALVLPKIEFFQKLFAPQKQAPLSYSKFPEGFPLPPVLPLPHGKQEWKFSHGDEVTGPKIQGAIVDPLDPSYGDKQTVTIMVNDNSPVLGAVATVYTDNKQISHPLKFVSGSATEGVWQASWEVNDSYDYVYFIDFVVGGESGTWNGALTFR
jgi:hypothetical protein